MKVELVESFSAKSLPKFVRLIYEAVCKEYSAENVCLKYARDWMDTGDMLFGISVRQGPLAHGVKMDGEPEVEPRVEDVLEIFREVFKKDKAA